jgi:hypothetical protein
MHLRIAGLPSPAFMQRCLASVRDLSGHYGMIAQAFAAAAAGAGATAAC